MRPLRVGVFRIFAMGFQYLIFWEHPFGKGCSHFSQECGVPISQPLVSGEYGRPFPLEYTRVISG